MPSADWTARTAKPRRSVFGNYRADSSAAAIARQDPGPVLRSEYKPGAAGLQAAIDVAVARCFLYGFLAKAFEDPTEAGWQTLTSEECQRSLESACLTLAHEQPAMLAASRALEAALRTAEFERFLADYLAAFGHAARGRCPLNEIEYGDIKADPLFQPHRLADLAGFYRAFGLEVAEDADERHDHLCLELEFMSVLAAKEAYGLEHQLDSEDLAVCRGAQAKFLRDHLGRWTPAFTRRLAQMTGDSALGGLARFTRAFIEAECARFELVPGSEDLLLRPIDAAAESLCAACGLTQLPPGVQSPDQL